MFESAESEFVEGNVINCVVVSNVSKCNLDTDVSENVP